MSLLCSCISYVDRSRRCSRQKVSKSTQILLQTVPGSSTELNDWKICFITIQSSILAICTKLRCSLYEALPWRKTPLYHTFLLKKKKKNGGWKLKVKYLCLKWAKLSDTSTSVLHLQVYYFSTSSKLMSDIFAQISGRKKIFLWQQEWFKDRWNAIQQKQITNAWFLQGYYKGNCFLILKFCYHIELSVSQFSSLTLPVWKKTLVRKASCLKLCWNWYIFMKCFYLKETVILQQKCVLSK